MRARFRPSHGTVVAYLALFVALGGTAMASVIITSNSQVAQNTISGHKPPSGKHSNLIVGSVNGQDVAANSLTGANINEASLTGDARKLLYVAREPLPAGPTPIATVGPYTIKGQCEKFDGSADVHIYVNGPAGTANSTWSQTRNDSSDRGNHGTGFVIPANTDTDIVRVETLNGTFDRAGGTSMLRSGPTLVQVDFNAVVDYRSLSSVDCFIYGTATKAT